MPFDTALSGIRAANTDLTVTGNNIANASTTGFKSSRTEFGDVYATVGAGTSNAVGSGVRIQSVSQQFTQGNIAFTEQELDLAINGKGFFVLSQNGETRYTRAGAFGLDADGFVVNSDGARLQGFQADASGNIGGIADDIQIQTGNLDPRRTTSVNASFNLDASQPVLQSSGRQLTTEGVDVSVAQVGLQDATTTELLSNTFTLPLANDFTATSMDFDLTLSGEGTNIGTVSISLDAAEGVPPTISTYNDLRILTSVINSQIFAPSAPQETIDVVANAVDLGGGNYQIELRAVDEGLNSAIDITNASANLGQIGLSTALASTPGVPQVSNGYSAQAIDIVDPDGNTVTYTTAAGASAATIASELNSLQGVSATASTELTITSYNNSAGNLAVTVNGITLAGDTLAALESDINRLSSTTLPGISAQLDPSSSNLILRSASGGDIRLDIASTDDGDSVTVVGDPDSVPRTLEVDALGNGVAATSTDAGTNSLIVGGQIDIVLEEDFDLQPQTAGGLFQPLNPDQFTDIVLNAFDPADQATYNSATSMTIYDSLGIPHVMTQYFVKQEFDPLDPTTSQNHWQVHVQIDGQDVGDPDTSLPAPANTEPTRATFDLYFNDDGTINELLTDTILISNWIPLDENGQPNSAAGPQNVLAGGGVPIPEPPTSSNFVIDFADTTQFGADFSVNGIDQNGFATGRLSGLSIDNDGNIFARFTNGESRVLAQVAMADFENQEGLQPTGSTAWVENFDSGAPRIAAANTGSLGAIQSGALEESNVDLSEELVNLIIAQRNYQANAKTIETADTVTQSIINLR